MLSHAELNIKDTKVEVLFNKKYCYAEFISVDDVKECMINNIFKNISNNN